MKTLAALNSASKEDAIAWFMQTCTASSWCELMSEARPFSSVDSLQSCAAKIWQTMQKADFMEAFEGHPMIGDVSTLRAKYANTKALASNEQSGTANTTEATLEALHTGNLDYLNKHGFIFIICATGLSAEAMLEKLQARLPNETNIEMQTAANEQLKITQLRINKALTPQEN
ncbi:2-oxo-4-hydroxy-4-carboxy-5-ureidoimidazoline decarboxylase [Glaciecola sp. 2405UD65-10]|uniref:2-oxo-4-hydroxy-4-carboxy-5-ureidoimidazoline decarboxylase n=1 Tax=Glaciecola sp. 2405UD65-10 TaxID=3397244 RepID=UPI003B58EEBD